MWYARVPASAYMRVLIYCRILDLCHSALVAASLWDSIIKPYGDFDMIDRIPWCVSFYYLL